MLCVLLYNVYLWKWLGIFNVTYVLSILRLFKGANENIGFLQVFINLLMIQNKMTNIYFDKLKLTGTALWCSARTHESKIAEVRI